MSKKIVVLTLGSRGDMQPFIALGQGLQAAGFGVTLYTADLFADCVREHGRDYAFMPGAGHQ